MARALAMVATLLVLAAPLAAQAPTADQLQVFQGLTSEQQQALLERLAAGTDSTGNQESIAAVNDLKEGGERANAQDPGRTRTEVRAVIPVLAARDSVTLDVAIASDAPPADEVRLADIRTLVLARNPYELDRNAQLNLPGFAPVALGGLTDSQATQRLALEPALAGLTVKLKRLPLEKPELKPFGYDFFGQFSTRPASVADSPVPADYVVGAGDKFTVQLFGSQNRNLSLTVNREGFVSFPELGPIQVGGMSFAAARRSIETRVQSQLIGVRASVSMAETRAINVFVLGEARRPGSYVVNGLATMTTALFASGGVSDIGSLRDIQLKRQGETVRHLDLYDLLVGGDTSGDAKLLAGDVVFIPPVGSTVAVDGEVRRPAIYEMRSGGNVGDLLRIAGGVTPDADTGRASLMRVDDESRRVVLDVSLKDEAGRNQLLRNGDLLRVVPLRPQVDAGIVIEGFVHRPGLFAWRQGMRVTDVIGSIEELRAGADPHYILIRREDGADRRVSWHSADLTAALAARGSAADPLLAARDQILVFEVGTGRDRLIQPWLQELRLQAAIDRPAEIVSVRGRVRAAGEYPLEQGMRILDLLRAGGSLLPSAYGGSAELTRYSINTSGAREGRRITVDLAAVLRGDANANIELRPADDLFVQETPDWGEQQTIILRGEVRFPGTYLVSKGETLHQVLDRAGGLTGQAFPEGSAFTRSDLKVLEQQQLDRLAVTMRGDLVTIAMQAARAGQANSTDALLAGQAMLAQLQATKAVGRFVIDLPGLLESSVNSDKDVVLRSGDELYVPRRRQEVTVIGEVQNSTSHLFQRSHARADYIRMSGGTTRRADRSRVYVVRADGSVAMDNAIKPGDTIVVPVDADRMPRLPFWQAVTQILYNVAVSVAAVNSF